MGLFTVGEVVTVIFPYSDLSVFKKRPALIIGIAEFGNYITCQITSNDSTSKKAIRITNTDLSKGELKAMSYIRPDKIFTLDPSLVQKKIGRLTDQKLVEAKIAVRDIFK